MPEKINYIDFASNIREYYPDFKEGNNDFEFVQNFLAQYPQYRGGVSFDVRSSGVKAKTTPTKTQKPSDRLDLFQRAQDVPPYLQQIGTGISRSAQQVTGFEDTRIDAALQYSNKFARKKEDPEITRENITPQNILDYTTYNIKKAGLGSEGPSTRINAVTAANDIYLRNLSNMASEKYGIDLNELINSEDPIEQDYVQAADMSSQLKLLAEQYKNAGDMATYNDFTQQAGLLDEYTGELSKDPNLSSRVSAKAEFFPKIEGMAKDSKLKVDAIRSDATIKKLTSDAMDYSFVPTKYAKELARDYIGGTMYWIADLFGSDRAKNFVLNSPILSKDPLYQDEQFMSPKEPGKDIQWDRVPGFVYKQTLNMIPAIAGGMALGPAAGTALANVAGVARGTAAATNIARGTTVGARMLGTALTTYDDAIYELDQAASKSGTYVSPSQKSMLAAGATAKTAIIESLNPLDRAFKGGLIKNFAGSAVNALATGKGFRYAMLNGANALTQAAKVGGLEIGEELLDETVQRGINAYSNEVLGLEGTPGVLKEEIPTAQEYADITINTLIATVPFMGAGAVSASSNFKNDAFHSVSRQGLANDFLLKMEENIDQIGAKKFKAISNELQKVNNAYKGIPKEYDEDAARAIADKSIQIEELKGQLNSAPSQVIKDKIKAKIQFLENEILDIDATQEKAVASGEQPPVYNPVQTTPAVSDQEDENVLRIVSERVEPILQSLTQRMTNAEEIDMNEIETVAEQMIDEQSRILESETLSETEKGTLSQLIELQVNNLLNYEFATITTTEQAGEKTKTASLVATPREGRPLPESVVSRDRFNGAGVRIGGRGAGRITIKRIPGFGGRSVYGISFGNRKGVAPVEDLEFDNLEFVASEVLGDGSLNVRVKDSKSGLEFTITDPELSMDLAIAAQLKEAGRKEFPQPAFLEAVREVTPGQPIQVTTFPNLGRTGTTPAAVGVQPQTEQDVRQETNAPQEGRAQGEDVTPVPQEEGRQEGQVTPPAVEQEGETPPATGKKTRKTEQQKADEGKAILDKLKETLRALKAKPGGGANIDLTFGIVPISKAVWNTAIDTAILAIDAGQSIAQAVKAASDYISSKIDGDWGNAKFGQYMEDLLTEARGMIRERVSYIPFPEGLALVDGWYSTIEKKVREAKQDKQSASAWLNSGLIGKGDEATYTGVRGWLEEKKPNEAVSKQEILDWMKDNRIEINEVAKSDEPKVSIDEAKRVFEDNGYYVGTDRNGDIYVEKEGDFRPYSYEEMSPIQQDAFDALTKNNLDRRISDPTKYSNYQLEGKKENYKEVVVTLPSEAGNLNEIAQSLYQKRYTELNPSERVAVKREARKSGQVVDESGIFKSTHFDEPNILVHLRMNTRTDADGNKVLFLEEVQSDWGQKGKKGGFYENNLIADLESQLSKAEATEKSNDLALRNAIDKIKENNKDASVFEELQNGNKAIEKLYNKAQEAFKARKEISDKIKELKGSRLIGGNKNVPTAPFVTDTNAWTKLAVKIAMREAAKQGVDKIAWTTGEQQNERYDLSKQVDYITKDVDKINEDRSYVDISTTNGLITLIIDNRIEPGKILGVSNQGTSDMVGKNIEDVVGKDVATRIIDGKDGLRLEGEGLKLGGKGMKGFYDKIVPDAFKSVVKELTGQDAVIGETTLNTPEKTTQQSIPLTTRLKGQIERGMPLFEGEKASVQQRAEKVRGDITKATEALTQAQQEGVEEIAKALEKALNAMKVKIDRGAAREATFMIPALIYNSAIDAAILTVKAADIVTKEVIIKAINVAVKYINENFEGEWDNNGFLEKLSVDLTKPMESYVLYKDAKAKGREPVVGQKVGVRFNLSVLDYGRKGVLSVHDKTFNGDVIDMVKASTVNNVKFSASKSGAKKIKEGESNKFPMASVDGSFVSNDVDESVVENGQRVFFNPKITDFFYDKDGREVLSASRATVDGPKVFAEGLKYGNRVIDLSQQQAQAETKATRKAKTVFHSGTLDGKGNIYVSPIREQANEYSSMSGAPVLEFEINENAMAPESEVRDLIRSLGLKLPEGYNLDELFLYEALDTRVKSSLSQGDIDKLYAALKDKGYEGIAFRDEDIRGIKKEGIDNFIVFDKSSLSEQQAQPEAQVDATAKALDGVDTQPLKRQLGIEANWDMIGEGDALSGGDPMLAYTQRQLPNWNRESQRGNINPNSKITYDIVRGEYGGIDQKDVVEAKDENGVTIGIVKLDEKGGIKHIAVAPEFRGKGVSDKLIQTLKENNPQLDLSKTKLRSKGFEKAFGNKIIAEAYQKAKANGSNPELVQAVDKLLGQTPEAKPEKTTTEQRKEGVKSAAQKAAKSFNNWVTGDGNKLGIANLPEQDAERFAQLVKDIGVLAEALVESGMTRAETALRAIKPYFETNYSEWLRLANVYFKSEFNLALIQKYPEVYKRGQKLQKEFDKTLKQRDALLAKDIEEAKAEIIGKIKSRLNPSNWATKTKAKLAKTRLTPESISDLKAYSKLFTDEDLSEMDPKMLKELYKEIDQIYKSGRRSQIANNKVLNEQARNLRQRSVISVGKSLGLTESVSSYEIAKKKAQRPGVRFYIMLNSDPNVIQEVDRKDIDSWKDFFGAKGFTTIAIDVNANTSSKQKGLLGKLKSGINAMAINNLFDTRNVMALLANDEDAFNMFEKNFIDLIYKSDFERDELKNTIGRFDSIAQKLKQNGYDIGKKEKSIVLRLGDNNAEGTNEDGLTIGQIIDVFMMLRDPDALVRAGGEGLVNYNQEDINKIIDYVLSNKPVLDAVEEVTAKYQDVLQEYVLPTLSTFGYDVEKFNTRTYNTNGSFSKNDAENARAIEILNRVYSNNIPQSVPYSPLSVFSGEEMIGNDYDVTDPSQKEKAISVLSNNVISRIGGGQLQFGNVANKYNNYMNGMIDMVTRMPVLHNAQAIFSKDVSRLIENKLGESATKAIKNNINRVVTNRLSVSEEGSSIGPAISNWINRAVLGQMFINTRSAVFQPIATLNYAAVAPDIEEYVKSTGRMLSPNNFAETIKEILNQPWVKERFGGKIFSIDAKELDERTKEGQPIYWTITDQLLKAGYTLTAAGDLSSIFVGGSPLYDSVKNSKYNEYIKTMSEKNAEAQSIKDASLALYKATNESQQSSNNLLISNAQKNPLVRLLLSFTTANQQLLRRAILAGQMMKLGVGSPQRNAYTILQFGMINAALFTLVSRTPELLFGLFDDDEEDMKKKKKKDALKDKYINDVLGGLMSGLGAPGVLLYGSMRGLLPELVSDEKFDKVTGVERLYRLQKNLSESVSASAPGVSIKLRQLTDAAKATKEGEYLKSAASAISFGTGFPTARLYDLYGQAAETATRDYTGMERFLRATDIYNKGWAERNYEEQVLRGKTPALSKIEEKEIKDKNTKELNELMRDLGFRAASQNEAGMKASIEKVKKYSEYAAKNYSLTKDQYETLVENFNRGYFAGTLPKEFVDYGRMSSQTKVEEIAKKINSFENDLERQEYLLKLDSANANQTLFSASEVKRIKELIE